MKLARKIIGVQQPPDEQAGRADITTKLDDAVRENFHHENSVRGKNSGRKKILIMGGGLGLLSKTDEVLRRLSSEKELDITVITGNNRELKNKLERDYPHMRIM